jgi:hypothetical protein
MRIETFVVVQLLNFLFRVMGDPGWEIVSPEGLFAWILSLPPTIFWESTLENNINAPFHILSLYHS